MKLATLRNGTRDGQLLIVSKDLSIAVKVPDIANTLQQVMDQWEEQAPRLEEVYDELNAHRRQDTIDFNQEQCESPLPRAYHWADASAYVNHVRLVRKARGAEMPESFWTDPLLYQGGSDTFLAPYDPIPLQSEDWGLDLEGEVAVITDDVPQGTAPDKTEPHIKLLMLVNDVSLRNLIPSELAKGFGFYQGKPSTAFSPVAVTPDELGPAWNSGKVNLPLLTKLNDVEIGHPHAGVDMVFNFYALISHAAKTRRLGAGTIIGSGTVSNKDTSVGSSCLAEKRMLEIIDSGQATTPLLRFGDELQLEMFDNAGHSIFGAIRQQVVPFSAD